MKERGILFSREMVLALLAGRKTVTRRMSAQWDGLVVGQRLWVRETWAPADARYSMVPVLYRADGDAQAVEGNRWRPSLHMPRWASRILLEVTEPVRVERVQDITEEDAIREGVERDDEPCDHSRLSCDEIGCMGPTHKSAFVAIWQQLHTKPGERWEDNPTVRRIAFRRIAETA
jgi:hypothetical protein